MSTNHLISALVSSVNNAIAVKKQSISLKYSKITKGILSVLKEEGFISDFEVFEERANVKRIKVDLKYVRGRSSVQDFSVVSTPGKRIYSSSKSLIPYYDGLGFYIFSTSKGIFTDTKARHLNIGGEILCKIF